MSVFQRKQPPSEDTSQWTVETLREYVLTLIAANEVKYSERFEASQSAVNRAFIAQQTAMETALTAQKLSVDTALAAADRAVTKAETAAEKRFESVNEFRSTLSDQQRTLLPRSEGELLIRTLSEKYDILAKEIVTLREGHSEISGAKAGSREIIAYVFAAAGIALALIFHFVK